MNMRMAVKSDDSFGMTKPEIFGRVKSDITHGNETLYERSYY